MIRKPTLALIVVLVVTGAAVTQVAAVPGVIAQQETPDAPDNGTDAPDNETDAPDDGTDTPDNETDAPAAEAGLSVDSLSAPESAAPGSNVTVVAVVSNDADERVTESVEFRVGGAVVDRSLVSVDAGESAVVELSASTAGLDAGTYTHGVFTGSDGAVAELTLSESFALDELDAPESTSAGETITVEATVSNPNDFETTQDVTFRLGGTPLASEEVTLGGGETETVTFDISTEGLEPGDYTHGVFTRDAGQFAAIEVTEPLPTESTVTFDDQESDGTTVTVQNVALPSSGYVAIHDDGLLEGDAVGSVVGVSEYLEAGTYENVTVTLYDVEGAEFNESELGEDQTLIAMPHNETTDNEVYEFVSSNGTADGPFVADGEPVTDDAAVTVATATEEPTDNATEEPADGTATEEPADGTATEEPADGTATEATANGTATEEPTAATTDAGTVTTTATS